MYKIPKFEQKSTFQSILSFQFLIALDYASELKIGPIWDLNQHFLELTFGLHLHFKYLFDLKVIFCYLKLICIMINWIC